MVGAFPELEEEVKLFPEISINLMSRGWNLCPNIRMQGVILFLHLFINALRIEMSKKSPRGTTIG